MAFEYIDEPIRQTTDDGRQTPAQRGTVAPKIEYMDEPAAVSSKIEYLPDEPSAQVPLRETATTGQAAEQANIEARLEQRKAELAADTERAQLPTGLDIGKGLLSGFSGWVADTGQLMEQGRRISDPQYLAGKIVRAIGEKRGDPEIIQAGGRLESAAGMLPDLIKEKLAGAAEKRGLLNTATGIRAAGDIYTGKELIRSGEENTKTLQDSMTPGGREPSGLLGQVIMGAAQSAPSTLAAAVPATAGTSVLKAMQVAPKVTAALQKAKIGAKAAQAIGELVEMAVPASVVEGGQAGFQNARQTQRQIEEMPIEKLAQHPAFVQALDATDKTLAVTERMNQARQQVAKEAADYILAVTTPTTGGIGLLTGGGVLGRIASKGKGGLLNVLGRATGRKAGEETIQQALQMGAGTGRRVVRSVGRTLKNMAGGGFEETIQETPQSGAEQIIQNLAVRKYADQSQAPMEGAVQQAVVGGLSGGLIGLAGGGAAAFGAEPARSAVIPATPSANPEAAAMAAQVPAPVNLPPTERFTEAQQVGTDLLQGINSPEELDAARAVIREEIEKEKYAPKAGQGLAGAMMPEQDLVNVLGAALQKKQAAAVRATAVEAVRQGAGSPADEANKAALEAVVNGQRSEVSQQEQQIGAAGPPAETQIQDFPPAAGQSKIETVPAPSTQPISEPPTGAVPNGEAGSGPTLTPQQQSVVAVAAMPGAGNGGQNATQTGEQSGGNLGEHQRIAPGQNLPANQTQVQQGKGEQTGGGDRTGPVITGGPGAPVFAEGLRPGKAVEGANRTGERVAPAEPAKYRVHKGLVAEEVAKQQSRIDLKIDAARKGLAYIESNQLVPNKEVVIQQRQAAIAELEQNKATITPATVEEDLWKKKSRLIQERDKRWKKQFPTELGREVKRMGLRPNRTPDGRGWLEEEEFNERVPKEFRNYETGKPLDEAIPTLKTEGYLVEGTEEELQRKLGFDRELAAKGVTEDKFDEQQAMAWQDNETDWFERGSEVVDQGNLGVGSHWTEQGRPVSVKNENPNGLLLSDGTVLPIVDVGDPAGQVRIDKGSLQTGRQTPDAGRQTSERPKMPAPVSEQKPVVATPARDFFGKEVSKRGILPTPVSERKVSFAPFHAMVQYLQDNVFGKPKGVHVPDMTFKVSELTAADIEKIKPFLPDISERHKDVTVTGRVLKHTDEQHHADLERVHRQLPDMVKNIREVLHNFMRDNSAYIVTQEGGKNDLVIIELAKNGERTEIVNIFHKRDEDLERLRKKSGVWLDGGQSHHRLSSFEDAPVGASGAQPNSAERMSQETEKVKEEKRSKMPAAVSKRGITPKTITAKTEYNDLVRAVEAGVETRRKLNDTPLSLRRDTEGFAESGLPRNKQSVTKWLASHGTIGAVDNLVVDILKHLPLVDAARLEADAHGELQRRKTIEDTESGKKAKMPAARSDTAAFQRITELGWDTETRTAATEVSKREGTIKVMRGTFESPWFHTVKDAVAWAEKQGPAEEAIRRPATVKPARMPVARSKAKESQAQGQTAIETKSPIQSPPTAPKTPEAGQERKKIPVPMSEQVATKGETESMTVAGRARIAEIREIVSSERKRLGVSDWDKQIPHIENLEKHAAHISGTISRLENRQEAIDKNYKRANVEQRDEAIQDLQLLLDKDIRQGKEFQELKDSETYGGEDFTDPLNGDRIRHWQQRDGMYIGLVVDKNGLPRYWMSAQGPGEKEIRVGGIGPDIEEAIRKGREVIKDAEQSAYDMRKRVWTKTELNALRGTPQLGIIAFTRNLLATDKRTTSNDVLIDMILKDQEIKALKQAHNEKMAAIKPAAKDQGEIEKSPPYLNEQINYGGEMRSRGSVIAEMQKAGTSQKQIDAYMMGAKPVSSDVASTIPGIKPLAEMTSDEFKAQHVSERKDTAFIDHRKLIEQAEGAKKPINAEAVKRYGLVMDRGYVREGDQWVFKGDQVAVAEQMTDAGRRTPEIGSAGIKEAGDELTYNRRNRVVRRTWSDIEGLNPALKAKETTKANFWPKPDYAQMIADGRQPLVVHIVKQVYDSIAAKPATRTMPTDADFKLYIEAVSRVQEGVMKWVNDPAAVRAWAEKNARLAGALMGAQTEITSLAQGGESLIATVYPGGTRNFSDEIIILGNRKLMRALQPSYMEIKRGLNDIEKGWPGAREAWQVQGYRVVPSEPRLETVDQSAGRDPIQTLHIGGKYVNYFRKGQEQEATDALSQIKPFALFKNNRYVSSFDTEAEAIAGAHEATKRDKGQTISDKGISVEAAERIGPERRKEGEDITSQRIIDDFGFRGINFGNWMKTLSAKAEAQRHLNFAYDSLHDLAEILDVPPKALSLNGLLGLAIGAQGNGKYAAHFVPGVNEINLTRTGGAGSLAHEWGHALDHYFATQGGIATSGEPYMTEHVGDVGADGYIKRNGKKVVALEGVRPEIIANFKAIVDAMSNRPITEAEAATQAADGMRNREKVRDRWIASIRNDFKGQEADFDKLAERIKSGDMGEGKIKVSETAYLSPVLIEMRELYKQKNGRLYGLDNLKALQSWADMISYAKAHQETNKDHVPQLMSTDYAKNAGELDKDKGGKKYWSTKVEMFARAFDAYVSDALEAKAAKNTYLSHAGRSGETVPTGTERETINKAFSALVNEIETRATEKGVAMFSLANVKPWPEGFPNAVVQTTRANITRNYADDFDAAKAGDTRAADRVVQAVIKDGKVAEFGRKYPNAMLLPVHEEEVTGKNKLPIAYAEAISEISGLPVVLDIVQTERVFHRGQNAMVRLAHHANFEGRVISGQEYIIVDDHITQGGIIAELRHYVENNGGKIVAVTSLTASLDSTTIAIRKETVGELERKFGREQLESIIREHDIAGTIPALTESQGKYLLSFNSLDAIRNRIAEARPEGFFALAERTPEGESPQEISPEGVPPSDLSSRGMSRSDVIDATNAADLVGPVRTDQAGRQGISDAETIDVLNELADVVDVRLVEQVDTETDLPAEALAQAREKGYSGQVVAVAWDGKVWVVADRIRSADHLKVKIIHEMVHLGVREALSGSELNTVLTQTLGTFGRKMELAAIARRRGLSLDKEADYRTALEELIAKISEERRSKPNVWKRFVAAIRAYLRKKGYIKTLSDNDVDWLIEKALVAVGKGGQGVARFSLLDKGAKGDIVRSDESKQDQSRGLAEAMVRNDQGPVQQRTLAEAEIRRAYESAPVDGITGQASLITGRRILRDMAVRIAVRNRLNLQDWQRADAAASQSGPADNRATDHPEEKLVRDVKLAIDQGILPEIDLSTLGIDPQIARTLKWPWTGLESINLKRISTDTGEGIPFQSPDGKAVYKLWMPYRIGSSERYIGAIPTFEETTEDKLAIVGDYGSLGQLLERIDVLSSIGGIPTEIAGVTDNGIVVTKQPFGRSALELKLAGVRAIDRARLQKVPHEVAAYSGKEAAYVTVVDGKPYLLTDLRDENYTVDSYGRQRFLDPLISRIPRWVLLSHPRLAAIVETARAAEKEAAALVDYGMTRPRDDIAFSLTDEGEQMPDQTGVDRSLADEYATILDMLERARPAISRAAGTGYAIGKAEGKEQLAERLTKTKEKMRGVLSERMAKLRTQAEERAAAAKEKADQAILAARIGERAKGRKEAIKEGMAIGFARGEELGRTMAIEDTVKLGFQEMAREHKQRYLDALRETENKLDAMEANLNIVDAQGNVTGRKTPEQIRQTQEWVLRQIFGPERFETFRNRPQGELLSVVAAVRNVGRKELAKHYTQGLERLLEKTNPDRLLPQYRDEWKTLTEGLTPEDVSRRNWGKVKDLYETLTELITHNRNEHRFVGDVRRADAQMAGEQAAVVLDKALPEIKGLERVTPARRGRAGYMMEDKTGTALTRALTLSGGDESAVVPEILHENLRKADTAAKAFEAQTVRPVTDLLKEQGLSDGRVIEMRTALRPVQIAGDMVMMTDAEKIELAAAWEDPETKVQISLAGFMPARRRGQLAARILGGTPGETADMVQAVLKTMTPEHKLIAMKMVDQLTGMAVEANKISVIRDGWEKFTKLRYWPRKVERATTQQTIDMDGFNSTMQNRQSLNAMGFTKERQEHTHPVLIGDAFATFFEHAHMMSKYAKMSLAAHDALTLIGNPVFSASVRTRVGTTFLRDTRDMITRLSGLRGYKSDSPGKRVLDALTRNVAVSILWFRPTSIIYNRYGGSFLAFTELLHENPAAARRFLARTILPVSLTSADGKSIIEKLMANGYLGDRWGHDMAHVYTPLPHERAGDMTNTRLKMRWRKMQEFGLRPMAHAEMRNAIAIFKALMANGYTEEQAVEACERITRTTQNPSSALEESAFYAEIKDRSLGWMFPFLGQPVVSRNLIMRDYLRLNHAKAIDNKPEVRKARVLLASSVLGLVANIGLMLAVRAVMRKLSRPPPDDDERIGKAVLQNLSDAVGEIMDLLVPGSGRLADMGLNMLSGKQPREMSIFAGLQRDINNGFKNLLHPHDKDDEFDDAKLWSGVMHLIEGAGAVVGGPMGGPMVLERVLKNQLMPEEPKKSSGSGPRISGPRGDAFRARMQSVRERSRARSVGRSP